MQAYFFSWEITHKSLEELQPQKKFERPAESLAGLIGEDFPLYEDNM